MELGLNEDHSIFVAFAPRIIAIVLGGKGGSLDLLPV
jgi:hypothetical protein